MIVWSAAELPNMPLARRALAITTLLVLLIASGILPVVIAAMAAATAMLAANCLNVRQAARAVDIKVVMLVGAALAMGTALQVTGGAAYLGALVVEARRAGLAYVDITTGEYATTELSVERVAGDTEKASEAR